MTLLRGRLHLAPRPRDRSPYAPIDTFFRSLAEHDPRSLGRRRARRLSVGRRRRPARDQSRRRLHDRAGARDREFRRHAARRDRHGRRRSDPFAGAIAAELTRIGAHPFSAGRQRCPARPRRAARDGRAAREAVLSAARRQRRRLRAVQASDDQAPAAAPDGAAQNDATSTSTLTSSNTSPREVENLYRDILIHVTRFFREPDSFDALKKLVFPRSSATRAGKRPIRIWVPGCATGEEAYSIAIALLEYLGDDANSTPVQIFATDVSEEAIERARAGVYPESITATCRRSGCGGFSLRVDGHYRVSKLVRDSCIFARQDLTRDPPFSKLDLIVCRNVLIYLGPRLQRKLMGVFHYALKPSGFLMLGAPSRSAPQVELFAIQVTSGTRSTRSAAGIAPRAIDVHRRSRERLRSRPRRTRGRRAAGASRQRLQAEVTRLLLGRYSPPGVVVDSDLQIVQTRGKTGPFLELAAGEASLNLLKMAREGLLHGLRSAFSEAQQDRQAGAARRLDGQAVERHERARSTSQVLPFADGERYAAFSRPLRRAAPQRAIDARGARQAAARQTKQRRPARRAASAGADRRAASICSRSSRTSRPPTKNCSRPTRRSSRATRSCKAPTKSSTPPRKNCSPPTRS